MPALPDRWTAGTTYEAFMGRWSRRIAAPFLHWLAAPSGLDWLDVGCGTGALSNAICEHADPASVTACDPAAPFIAFASEQPHDPRLKFLVADTTNLPPREGGYGQVTSAFALNFIPDPAAALRAMAAAAAPGATVSACVWDYAEGMEFLRRFWDVATELDPAARVLDEGVRFPVCRPAPLLALFSEAGLQRAACEPIEIVTAFRDFDDYWTPFLGGTGPAPSYVASLTPEHRSALADRLQQELPHAPDGSIGLIAGAWAVRGMAPS